MARPLLGLGGCFGLDPRADPARIWYAGVLSTSHGSGRLQSPRSHKSHGFAASATSATGFVSFVPTPILALRAGFAELAPGLHMLSRLEREPR